MAEFTELADAIVDDLLEQSPEEATDLGDHRFDDRLAARDQAAVDERMRRWQSHLRALEQWDAASLEPEAAADLLILRDELELRTFLDQEERAHLWNPLLYNPGNGLFPLLSQATQTPERRLRGLCSRLEQIPELVEVGLKQLQNPPRVHVETALQQHPGVVQLIQGSIDQLARGIADIGLRGRVAKAQSQALAAWERFGAHLQETLESASGDFRLGPQRFQRKLRLALHSPLESQDVLSRAQRRVEEASAELADVSGELTDGRGTAAERIRLALEKVAERRPDDSTVLTEAGAATAELDRAVRESGLFTVPQDLFDLEVVPEFMRGVASAYCMPAGPFEEGARTKVMIAPTPQSWSKEQVESFYREINSAMMVILMAHEATPGHALQLAVARRFRGPTKVRRAFYNGPFVEGWACQAERIVGEFGLGGLPARTQLLKMQIRTAMNALLDAAVHVQDMSREEAVAMMVERGFQERSEAENKWRRACLTSAQLSTYFVGYSELQDLFQALAPMTSYDEVLAHGSPPVSLLRGLIRA
ncbi:MAG: DUF885 domain-containing protein [Candidatus Dormibacteria bacterium]